MCKWLVPFIITPLIIPVSFFSLPQKINAQAPGVPIAEVGPNALVQIKNTLENTLSATKEYVLDNLTTVLAKTLIRQISQSTINWINSGFKGSPSFIQNPEQFFIGVADLVAGDFIESIGFGFLCEPFRLNLQLSLALQYGGQNSDTDLGCTFSDVLGNIEGFVEGDFTQGGWDGFFNVSQKRQNNPYGAYLQAKTALDIKIATAQGTERMKLDWGSGFQSLTDELGNILTPGATIEAQLSEVLGTDLRQLELADEINEIMGALVGQLIGQVMSATGLAGSPKSSSGYNSDYAYKTNQNFDSDFLSSVNNAESLYGDLQEDTGNSIEQDASSANFSGFNDTNETGTVNLALGRQSETAQSGIRRSGGDEAFESGFAVDGRTSGDATDNDPNTAAGAETPNAWWQVDLGEVKALGEIKIYRRFDLSAVETIGQFRIFVSSVPFTCEENPPFSCIVNGTIFNPLNPPANIYASEVITVQNATARPLTRLLNTRGRFVMVQRVDNRNEALQLSEVQIFRNNAPQITLNGSNNITLRTGEPYVEQNAEAFDQSDADRGINAGVVPVMITITKDNLAVPAVDINTIGQYIVTYTATDSGGAVAKKSRRVTVVEAN